MRKRRPRSARHGRTNRRSVEEMRRRESFVRREKQRVRKARKLSAMLYETGMKTCNGEFRKLFRMFDVDGDGQISREDFREAMKQRPNDPTTSLDEMYDAIDENNDGVIKYHEFCDVFYQNPTLSLRGNTIRTTTFEDPNACRTLPAGTMEKEGNRVLMDIATKMRTISVTDRLLYRDDNETLIAMFKEMDEDGNGSLSYEEFGRAVRKMKIDVQEDDLALACRALDTNMDGAIDYGEFLDKFAKADALSTYDPFRAGRKRALAALSSKVRQVDRSEEGNAVERHEEDSKRRGSSSSTASTLSSDVIDEETKETACASVEETVPVEPTPRRPMTATSSRSTATTWRELMRRQRPRTAHANLFRSELSKRMSKKTRSFAILRDLRRRRSPSTTTSSSTTATRRHRSPKRFELRSPPLAKTTRNLGLEPIRGQSIARPTTTSRLHFGDPSKSESLYVHPDKTREMLRRAFKKRQLRAYASTRARNDAERRRQREMRDANRIAAKASQKLRYLSVLDSMQKVVFKPTGKRSMHSILRREGGSFVRSSRGR